MNRYDGYDIKIYTSNNEDPGAISGNEITDVYVDRSGKLWIGVHGFGIELYDPVFDAFIHYPYEQIGLRSSEILDIYQDSEMNIWVGTQEGVDYFDVNMNKIKSIPIDEENLNEYATSSAAIFKIFEDEKGVIWLGCYNGLNKYDKKTGLINHYFPDGNPRQVSNENWIKSIIEGWNNDLWLAGQAGFYIFNKNTGTFRDGFRALGTDYSRNVRGLNDILIDNDGNIWFAGWEGAALYSPGERTINYLHENRYLPFSFPQGSTIKLFMDNIGSVWLGTWNRGISYHNKEIRKFGLLSKKYDPNGLTGEIVRAIITDQENNFWIGIDLGGLVYYNRETGKYKYYRHQPGSPNSLIHDNVRCLLLEEECNQLWIGTQHGLDLLNLENNEFSHFLNNEEEESLASNDIRFLMKDIYENIWIGTFSGISVYKPGKDSFINYYSEANNPSTLSDNRIYSIFEDSRRNIWVGTRNGLNKFNPEDGSFTRYLPTDDSLSLNNEFVTTIFEDSKKRLWIGTYGGGLNLMDKENNCFSHYTTKEGLPNNVIYGILEDSNGFLWISTNKGICKLNPETFICKNYDRDDGLQSNQFYFNAFHKSKNGELLFGGVKGLNYFYPEIIKDNLIQPRVVITDFRLFNLPVAVEKDEDAILSRHISITDSITLKHDQSVFSFDFVSIHLGQPQKHQFAYKLEGLEENWNYVGNNRTATYTNLDAGDYLFRVKASNGNGIWNEKGKSVHLKILPPWWETTLFRIILALMVVGIFYLLALLIRNREQLKTNLKLERIKAEKDRELDAMKLKFYSNISHEFRTPLTLILGPVESMVKEGFNHSESRSQLNIVNKNARRLLRLINQLLDLSKIESGYMKLSVKNGDIIKYIENIADTFNYRAEELDVQYVKDLNPSGFIGWFDPDKIEKILYNLLSNAFKYTGDKGRVKLETYIQNNILYENGQKSNTLFIKISDTGPGISAENKDRIFNRFYQDNYGKKENPGTGIGLTLTKQLTEIHKGNIHVESQPGKGSVFTISIPVSRNLYSENEITAEELTDIVLPDHSPIDEEVKFTKENLPFNKDLPTIIIIDDNPDIRNYIEQNLNKKYNILSAANGQEGFEIISSRKPDIILCDVMMPEMDGFELCSRIKTTEELKHIPFLLLTAKTGIDNKLKGLEAGADDYIIKPFYIEEIDLKVRNFLKKKSGYNLKKIVRLSPSEIEITPPEEKFIKKALEIVEKYMDDSEFSIKKFSEEMGTSRMQLYRKIQAIANQTVKEFVRNIRLERAAQLLQKKAYTINEIAYMVGFREISYFRKCFKEKYGLTPTEYIAKNTPS